MVGARKRDGVVDLGRDGLSPVARFSLALGAVLAATALVLAGVSAYLIGRYVEDETTRFTQDAVASHFGSVFRNDVFERGLSSDEKKVLTRDVTFHLSIYNVVATQFFDRDGTLVFSYDGDEIGRQLDPSSMPEVAGALGGMRNAERATIIADPRLGTPASTVGFGSYDTHHVTAYGAPSGATPGPATRELSVLEAWVPVRQRDQVIGAAVVWRDVSGIDAALARIQLTVAAIIALATGLLWLVLRGVYVRSSQQIMRQATALEGALVERELTYDATLGALTNALDVRDSETGGHGDRVVSYMELVIRELGIVGDQMAMLRRGALLHDIGKIGVPDNVLRKPTALSEAEWATMKRHPEFGARIIAGIPFLEEVSRIVRHHHERWDGMGYPDGLAGEQVPLGARIFAVADSFDAMTSDRPYRRAMSIEAARAEIDRCRGTQFDPAVVLAFMRIPLAHLGNIAESAPHTHPRAVAS